MAFSDWDLGIHKMPEQVKRINSAKKIPNSKIKIDKLTSNAKFFGSSEVPYFVTLVSCTCQDFNIRKLPCKHIYRLSIELGNLTDLPVLNKTLAMTFDPQSEIDRYYALYEKGIISGNKFVKIADALLKGD